MKTSHVQSCDPFSQVKDDNRQLEVALRDAKAAVESRDSNAVLAAAEAEHKATEAERQLAVLQSSYASARAEVRVLRVLRGRMGSKSGVCSFCDFVFNAGARAEGSVGAGVCSSGRVPFLEYTHAHTDLHSHSHTHCRCRRCVPPWMRETRR